MSMFEGIQKNHFKVADPVTPKFELGQTVMTRAVGHYMEDEKIDNSEIMKLFKRHVEGDWGIVSNEDKEINDEALIGGERILSAYDLKGRKVWIITEWDRSATTLLFPEDY